MRDEIQQFVAILFEEQGPGCGNLRSQSVPVPSSRCVAACRKCGVLGGGRIEEFLIIKDLIVVHAAAKDTEIDS